MGLVEPQSNGIGGDLFAIVYEATSGALHGLNALALFGVAIYAGRRLRAAATVGLEQPEARTATPV